MTTKISVLNNIVGWCEWTLRNEDGSIATKGEGPNLFTRVGRRQIPGYMGLPTYIVLLDDERPAGIKEGLTTFKVDQLSPSPINAAAVSVSGFIRTLTTSFSSPSGVRTIRKIGLQGIEGSVFGPEEGGQSQVSAYLELSPAIVQQPGQSFEIVYRLAVVVNPAKNLKRWQTTTPIDESYFAADLVNGGIPAGNFFHFLHNVVGSHFFVDQGAEYRGVHIANGAQNFNTGGGATFSDGTIQRRGRDTTHLTTSGENDQVVGAYGMSAASRGSVNGNSDAALLDASKSYGFFPLVAYEGTLTSVFKHPAGETYPFNVIGSVALSQGAMEVRGPFRPDDSKTPFHWGHHVVIQDSGDTDPGTEGTYTVLRHGWVSYPYPSYYANPSDDTNSPCLGHGGLAIPGDVALGAPRPQLVFDGVDTYWYAGQFGGINARLARQRAGTNEQQFLDVVGDLTRYYGFDVRNANTAEYSLATDGAGIVFMVEASTLLAQQKVYQIDNRKPGRHYQRPSGVVLTASPQTFTVDAADEIHAMFPFVIGDVGRKIRTVSTLNNGADVVRTITAYNGPNSVDVDGAPFITESAMLWHFVTVTKVSTGALTGIVRRGNCEYDATNGRLWQLTAAGLEFSLNGGVTWTKIDETNGLTTALAKTVILQQGNETPRAFVIGNGGKLYWIDTSNAINKYTPVPVTVVSGTHERVLIASLPGFANGFTKGTLTSLCYDGTAPDQTTHTDGVLWLGQDRTYQRGLWRMACGPTFIAGGATPYDNWTIRGSNVNDYLDHSFQEAVVLSDGRVMLCTAVRNQWAVARVSETTGLITWSFEGAAISATTNGFYGMIHSRPDGRVAFFGGTSRADGGTLSGKPIQYRYNDLLDVWVPWHGTAAQFDARFGTTNGGKRKCHAAFQPILGVGKSHGISIRFVQLGVAPADEFKAAERFTFMAAWGVARTNVQDVTWRHDWSQALTETKVEAEAIKIATGRGAIQVFYQRYTSVGPGLPLALGGGGIPSLDNLGVNYGWLPVKGDLRLLGGGDAPDTSVVGGAVSYSIARIGLDLGVGPPPISRLHTLWRDGQWYIGQRFHRASADRADFRVFFSDDNSIWTEATAVRFKFNGASQPDAGYRYAYFAEYPYGGAIAENVGGARSMIFDLESAGLSVGARTHRYWQIHLGVSGAGNNFGTPSFGGVWAEDASSNPIGFTSNHRTDEAHDVDHGGSWIREVDFIQTRTGLSGQGGINTVDDGDGNGYTDTVTIAAGSFDTGVISTVTDLLAWKESPGSGNGFVRSGPAAAASRGMPWSLGHQARSRIIAVSPTTIQVASPIIPDNLAAVDFEIRRPGTTASFVAGCSPRYDIQSGYVQFHNADFGREFRITRKVIIRLP
jgi:hypothetical protein